MKAIHKQDDANLFLEGGLFYPTGYVVVAVENQDDARALHAALQSNGFGEVLCFSDREMAEQAQRNIDESNTASIIAMLGSVGATLPVREEQLRLAEAGHHFLIVPAPTDPEEQHLLGLLAKFDVRYAVKYRRLIIEDLIPQIPAGLDKAAPARVQ